MYIYIKYPNVIQQLKLVNPGGVSLSLRWSCGRQEGFGEDGVRTAGRSPSHTSSDEKVSGPEPPLPHVQDYGSS